GRCAQRAAKSTAWRTPVHLLFCRHGNQLTGQSNCWSCFFFRPPPAPPKWKLWRLLVRLVCLDSLSHSLKAHVELPTYLSSVSNSSGFAMHEFRSLDFACNFNCRAYGAKVVGLSFTNHLHCSHCQTSSTDEGCLYYPNGTVVYNGSLSGNSKDCRSPPQLRAQTGCIPEKHSASHAVLVSVTVGGITLALSLALLLALCCRRRRHPDDRRGASLKRCYSKSIQSDNNSDGTALGCGPVDSMLQDIHS
uniref:WSC domain-containing protein n=1 Tax=Macrostomum lignano TaxID=282301 RepID=A0A1I8FYI5_9PLAT